MSRRLVLINEALFGSSDLILKVFGIVCAIKEGFPNIARGAEDGDFIEEKPADISFPVDGLTHFGPDIVGNCLTSLFIDENSGGYRDQFGELFLLIFPLFGFLEKLITEVADPFDITGFDLAREKLVGEIKLLIGEEGVTGKLFRLLCSASFASAAAWACLSRSIRSAS